MKININNLTIGFKKVQKELSSLKSKRAKIDEKIGELETFLDTVRKDSPEVSKASEKRRPGRPAKTGNKPLKAKSFRKGSLVDVLTVVLASKPLTVDEIVESVKASGYKTKSKNFKLMVQQILSANKLFKRVGKGTYELKRKPS